MKKPSGQSLKSAGILTVGAIGGAAASNGLFGLAHNPSATTGPAFIKEHEALKRVAFMAAGVVAIVFAPKGDVGDGVRGAALGNIAIQSVGLIGMMSKKAGLTPEAEATTATAKFLARVAGLGCPCDQQGLGYTNVIDRWPTMYAEEQPFALNGGGGGFLDHHTVQAVDQFAA